MHSSEQIQRAYSELGEPVIYKQYEFSPPDQEISTENTWGNSDDDQLVANPIGKLARLFIWLYGERNSILSNSKLKITTRYAPSIIVRSEAELLSLSSPRFALRIYLQDKGFINARRLGKLHESITEKYGHDYFQGKLRAEIGRIREDNFCADSFLARPDDLKEYNILSVDLRREYDESSSVDMSQNLVPFMNSIAFGGGLCAQAVIFQTLCLLPGVKIMGPAEITLLAKPSQQETIEIGGLQCEEMRKFYDSCKRIDDADRHLHAVEQIEPIVVTAGKPGGQNTWEKQSRLTAAFRGYLQSGSPINYFVSSERMFSQPEAPHETQIDTDLRLTDKHIMNCEDPYMNPSVFLGSPRSTVPIQITYDRDKNKDSSHAIMIFGWHPKSEKFLINDPSTFPFLEADIKQLIDIRRYPYVKPSGSPRSKDKIRADSKNIPDELCDIDFKRLGDDFSHLFSNKPALFIGFHESNDILPLLKTKEIPFGMMIIARSFQASLHEQQKKYAYFRKRYQYGSWWLAEVSSQVTGQFKSECPFWDETQRKQMLEKLTQAISNENQQVPGWCWLQYITTPSSPEKLETIWIWDAVIERKGQSIMTIEPLDKIKRLKFVALISGNRFSVIYKEGNWCN